MYAFEENGSEHSVHSTGVPLSERFKSVPSHNPLRPNIGIKRSVASFGINAGPSDDFNDEEINPRLSNRLPFVRNGANKLAVLRATKDAEILRLRSQLRIMQLKLKRLTNGGNAGFSNGQSIPRIGNKLINRRRGGMMTGGHRGKNLILQANKALSVLGADQVVRVSRSPRQNRAQGNGKMNGNFFGSPKSKEDLDDELDKYMSKSKSKQKTDLDKELDEYMKVARAQSFAGKTGLIPTSPELTLIPTTPVPSVDSDDTEMEIAE